MKFRPFSDAELNRIFEKHVKNKYHVNCSEKHVHGFDCLDFIDEEAYIIERLRLEVVILRDKLKEIQEVARR